MPQNGKTKILLADGDPVGAVIKKRLEKAGYEVRRAMNVEEASALSCEMRPDVVVMEFKVPHMDGQILCQALKSNRQTASIPIIVFTWAEVDGYEARCFEAGAAAVTYKPVMTDLFRAIENARQGLFENDANADPYG